MAKIVVLYDSPDAAMLLKKILERKGHSVHAFTEGEKVIRHLRKHEVDLAILDVKLKKMCSIKVLQQLKAIDQQVKAMMLTGYPFVETAQHAHQAIVDEYFIKPIDKQDLEDKVAEMLVR